MNPMAWVISLSVATVAAWAIVVFFIPSCLCSMFRYRLWRLRDSVKDDVIYGRLPSHEFVNELLGVIESFILIANRVTLIQVFSLPGDRTDSARHQKALEEWAGKLNEQQNHLFLAHRTELKTIIVSRLLLGSITGWAFLVLLLPGIVLMLVRSLVQRASLTATDLVVGVVRWVVAATRRARREDSDLDWQDLTARVVRMQTIEDGSKTLSDCAA